jgi:hypothetical protein
MRRIGEGWYRKRDGSRTKLGKLDFDISIERVIAYIKAEMLLDIATGVLRHDLTVDREMIERYGRRDLAYMDDQFTDEVWGLIDLWLKSLGDDGVTQLVKLLHGVEL